MKTYNLYDENDLKKLPKVALVAIIKDVLTKSNEFEIKAKAFDVLMDLLTNDTYVMDIENYEKYISIQSGQQVINIPIQDHEFEILEKAIEVRKYECYKQ